MSVVAQLSITFVYLYIRFHYRLRFHTDLRSIYKDQGIRDSLKKVVPVILSTSGNEINKLVSRSVASSITVGGISSLVYANRLNALVNEICINSIITIQYPRLSEHASKNDMHGLKIEISSSLLFMLFFLLPATAIMLLFSRQIITFVYGHGNGMSAVDNATICFFYYSFGVVAVGIREILIRVFYSLGNTKTPAQIALIGICINIIGVFVLTYLFGFGGLALSTSISSIFVMFADYVMLNKRVPGILNYLQIKEIFKLIIATISISLIGYFCYEIVSQHVSSSVSLIFSLLLMCSLYLMLLIIMKSPIASGISGRIKKMYK